MSNIICTLCTPPPGMSMSVTRFCNITLGERTSNNRSSCRFSQRRSHIRCTRIEHNCNDGSPIFVATGTAGICDAAETPGAWDRISASFSAGGDWSLKIWWFCCLHLLPLFPFGLFFLSLGSISYICLHTCRCKISSPYTTDWPSVASYVNLLERFVHCWSEAQ